MQYQDRVPGRHGDDCELAVLPELTLGDVAQATKLITGLQDSCDADSPRNGRLAGCHLSFPASLPQEPQVHPVLAVYSVARRWATCSSTPTMLLLGLPEAGHPTLADAESSSDANAAGALAAQACSHSCCRPPGRSWRPVSTLRT
jgi:hypothetical protein